MIAESFDTLLAEIDAHDLSSEDAVEQFHVRYLSRKQGRVTELMKGIRDIAPEERRAYGQRVNEVKQRAEARLHDAREALRQARLSERPDIDLSLPGRRAPQGSVHPLRQTWEDIRDVFGRYGFSVAEGPEIEDDWHNFSALNFPPDHPARDMQDTFFMPQPDDALQPLLLRTHTSPVQVRVLEHTAPPIRIIAPGRVYRNEAISYKSFCLFHQVEGLYIDEGVSMADLRHMLHVFASAIFGDDVRMRFRPSFFPFTEPSAEVDIWWKDDALPGGGRWMEILGCGMVDPAVLEAVDVDPDRFTGYAFGMGVERIAMLRYGIDDIRLFYENDARFLQQF